MLARLILSRLVELVVVLFGVSLIVFLMIRLIPGDAVAIMLGANTEITPDRLAELRGRLGLDLPIIQQYLRWAGAALRGDFGVSIWTGRPVAAEIAAQAWPTLQLTLLSLVIGAGLAVPAGVLMAKWRGKRADAVLRIVTVIGLTTPSFWLGIILILLLAAVAPQVQALGYTPFSEDPLGNLTRLVLPAIALAVPIIAQLSRLVRSAMLDALSQDYVRTARAKGLSENVVVYRHALRNALIPFVTSLGVTAGYLLGGAIVVEQVFAIPGMGRLILGAITERNYPLVQASILVITCVFVIVNAVIDMLYVLLDPKLRS